MLVIVTDKLFEREKLHVDTFTTESGTLHYQNRTVSNLTRIRTHTREGARHAIKQTDLAHAKHTPMHHKHCLKTCASKKLAP